MAQAEVRLARKLGLWNGVAIILGVIVGSGIFVSPKGVLMHSGSVGAALCVWLACGLLALLGALCFAELGTSVASSGGEYTYIRLAYGRLASFLYIWALVLVIGPCNNAVAALTFANYCLEPFFYREGAGSRPNSSEGPPEGAVRLLAAGALMLLVYINCRTLNGSMALQSSFTLAKVSALALIVCYGLYYLFGGNPMRSLEAPPGRGGDWFEGTQTSVVQLARAFYSGFFTYSGW